jgi:hypothetical protein
VTGPGPGVLFLDTEPSTIACNLSQGVLECSLGSIPVGGMVQFVIRVRTGNPGNLRNLASVASLQVDPDLSDNSDGESTLVL